MIICYESWRSWPCPSVWTNQQVKRLLLLLGGRRMWVLSGRVTDTASTSHNISVTSHNNIDSRRILILNRINLSEYIIRYVNMYQEQEHTDKLSRLNFFDKKYWILYFNIECSYLWLWLKYKHYYICVRCQVSVIPSSVCRAQAMIRWLPSCLQLLQAVAWAL